MSGSSSIFLIIANSHFKCLMMSSEFVNVSFGINISSMY
jgi:hypothetical protein